MHCRTLLKTIILCCVLYAPSLFAYQTVSPPENIIISPTANQHLSHYIGPHPNRPLISNKKQQQLKKMFLQHYFSPWHHHYYFSPLTIEHDIENSKQLLQQNTFYAINMQHYSRRYVHRLLNNMSMQHFNQHPVNAIMTENSNIRAIPTLQPAYSDMALNTILAGDSNQESYITAGTPIHVIAYTKDRSWALVITSSSYGWIQNNSFALVNQAFIHHWQQSHHYVDILSDHWSIIDNQQIYRFTSHMGTLFPLISANHKYDAILIPLKNLHQDAATAIVYIPKTIAPDWPMTLTANNVATIGANFNHHLYGWGGIYGLRDCSRTTKDLLSFFGIWLPRKSKAQMNTYHHIALDQLTNQEKINSIIKHAVPFLSLLYLPGHIMLYIGHQHHQAYIFHDLWGLKLKAKGSVDGRAVIGKTIISSINLGGNIPQAQERIVDKLSAIVTP